MAKSPRLEWDTYFMQICRVVAQRSTCTRAAVGAVIVKDRTILATGYNGSPVGMPHCTEVGCLVYNSTDPDGQTEENCFRTIHAEINAIGQAAKHGVSIAGSSVYITHSPCIHCLKVLINVGIQRICFEKPYKLERVEDMVRRSGISLSPVTMDGVTSP